MTFYVQTAPEMDDTNNMSGMEDILSRLKMNDSRKPSPSLETKAQKPDFGTLDKLLNNLQDQNKTLKEQGKELKNETDHHSHKDSDHSSGSSLCPPGSDASAAAKSGAPNAIATGNADVAEMMRVKQELEAAKSLISRQEQELAETRNLKQTMDQAMGPPSEIDFGASHEISEQAIGHLQSAFNASARPFTSRSETWAGPEEQRAEHPEAPASANFGRGRGIWNNPSASMTNNLGHNAPGTAFPHPRDLRLSGQAYNGVYGGTMSPAEAPYQTRNFSGSAAAPLGYDMRPNSEMMQYNAPIGMRRNGGQLRINPTLADPLAQFGSYPPGASALTPPPISPMGLPAQYNYQRGLATPITPAAPDFPTNTAQGAGAPWSLPVSVSCLVLANSLTQFRLAA
jgi:hypothetical protein